MTQPADRPAPSTDAPTPGADCALFRPGSPALSSPEAPHSVEFADLHHYLPELRRSERLIPVAHRLLRIPMDLHYDPVRTACERSQTHGFYKVHTPGPVTRIRQNREVCEALRSGNSRKIKSVSGVRFMGPDAPLAQNYSRVAFIENILRAVQPFFEGGMHAPLEKHRLIRTPHLLEQRKILHVPSSNLEKIGIFTYPPHISGIYYLSHYWKPCFFSRILEYLQCFETETLKCIW